MLSAAGSMAGLAAEQHAAYVRAIADAGWAIREAPPADDLPDSAFVEDTLVVCGELAVLTRPGAPERCAELAGTEEAVRALGLEIARIEEPGTLDGGDVLQVGTTVYVGRGWADERRRHPTAAQARGSAGLDRRPRPAAAGAAPQVGGHRPPDGTIIGARRVAARRLSVPDDAIGPGGGGAHVVPLGRGTLLMAASAPALRSSVRRLGLRRDRRGHQRVREDGGLRDLPLGARSHTEARELKFGYDSARSRLSNALPQPSSCERTGFLVPQAAVGEADRGHAVALLELELDQLARGVAVPDPGEGQPVGRLDLV